jgi:hypothetical protein
VSLLLGAEHLALAAAGAHVVDRLVCEQAVVVDRLDGQVDAVVGHVGVIRVDQLADHRDHLVDVLGGSWHVGGAFDADALHRLEPDPLALGRDVLPRAILASGALDDLVLDVGDVRHEADLEPAPLEVAAQDVVDERGATVAEMRRAVHGGTAQVDADLARLA